MVDTAGGRGMAKLLPWLWTVLALIVAWIFINAAVDKLVGESAALKPFEEIGLPLWMAWLTAVGEIVASVALVIPVTRLFGGLLLSAIMVGAATVNLLNGHPDYVWVNIALIIGPLALAWQGRRYVRLPRRRRA